MQHLRKIAQENKIVGREFSDFVKWACKGNYQNLSLPQFIYLYVVRHNPKFESYKTTHPVKAIHKIISLYRERKEGRE